MQIRTASLEILESNDKTVDIPEAREKILENTVDTSDTHALTSKHGFPNDGSTKSMNANLKTFGVTQNQLRNVETFGPTLPARGGLVENLVARFSTNARSMYLI